jgi:hypothetical protein
MDMASDTLLSVVTVIIFIVSGVFGVIGYLLAQKDTKQGKDIDMLFLIHKEDAEKLEALKLEIAGDYHKKPEIDRIMAENRSYLNEKFGYIEKLIMAASQSHKS